VHTEFRKLVSRGFTPRPKVGRAVEPKVREITVGRAHRGVARETAGGDRKNVAELFQPSWAPSVEVVARH